MKVAHRFIGEMSRHPYRESVKRTTELSFVTFSRPLCGLNLYSALIPSSKTAGLLSFVRFAD